ncbi:fibroleukin-like [Oncorhynchus mykiss]|uniref:fibroleukin-like n=1 Tax=Oncorhynchus mykiss TaxID=8022 RepID=UPI0018780E4F|nr:fibroleukin-like [Oncorhynchus mykiss]
MRLAVLCVCGTLLAFSTPPGNYANLSKGDFNWGTDSGSCLVTIKPAGKCGGEGMDEDACPYRVTLPPLDVMLPRQLRELERTVKEVQRLKETVEQLKRACMECRISQMERERERLGDREREKEEKEKVRCCPKAQSTQPNQLNKLKPNDLSKNWLNFNQP